MKQLFILSVFLSSVCFASAQSLESVAELLDKKQWKEAKAAIDKAIADPATAAKSDAWYFKAKAYNNYSYEPGITKDEAYKLKLEAFDAFKKTQQLDPKLDLRMKTEQYTSYLDLYFGLFDLGATQFNDKNYQLAFDAFKKANEVKDFILSKNYTYTQAKLYPLDTALVLNTAIAASQLKKEDDAIIYYRKLIDANVSGKDYEDIYLLAADYYSNKADQANLDAVLTKGKSLYPTNEYWNELELKKVSKSGDKAALYAKYDELIAKNPASFALAYNYAIEIYNSIYGQDPRPADIPAAKAKLTSVLKTAINNDKGIDATELMSNHLFGIAADINQSAATTKDAKKKAELKAESIRKMDEFIPYGEAVVKYYEAQPSLKASQKAKLQNTLSYLTEVYAAKGDKKKSEDYDRKKQAIKF